MQYGGAKILEDLSYTRNHLWMKMMAGLCTLGWTDYIQRNAGDVNHIELAETGTMVDEDEDFGSIETSKWVERLHSPVRGCIIEVNDAVISHPGLINAAPFTKGWMVRIRPNGKTGLQKVMTAMQYLEYLKACDTEASQP